MLKNRATGKCLATDFKSGSTDKANGVWTSACNESTVGQRWRFVYIEGTNEGYLRSSYGTFLRVSDTPQAVYTDDSYYAPEGGYVWATSLT